MGASGQGCLGVGLGLMRQSLGQVEELVGDRPSLFPQIHAHQGGDLVVAGSARAQSTAQFGADTCDEATFQRGVYVVVLQYGGEGPEATSVSSRPRPSIIRSSSSSVSRPTR